MGFDPDAYIAQKTASAPGAQPQSRTDEGPQLLRAVGYTRDHGRPLLRLGQSITRVL